MSKEILLGDEAVALGAVQAGLTAAYSYPGTPASEIMEYLLRINGQQPLGEILPQVVLGGKGNFLEIVQRTDIVAAGDPRLAQPPLVEMRLDGLIDHVTQLLKLHLP